MAFGGILVSVVADTAKNTAKRVAYSGAVRGTTEEDI
jgi:hypothetical protein